MRLFIGILGLTLLLGTAAAEEITLRDGTRLSGTLVRLEPSTYIMQAEGTLYELSEDELSDETLTGLDRRALAKPRPPFVSHHYMEINPDGTYTHYMTMIHENTSDKAVKETSWGLAPWERQVVDQRSYIDNLGNVLVRTYSPPREKWGDDPDGRVKVTLHGAVPVGPGETVTITSKDTSYRVQRGENGESVYMFVGDFSEDRLVELKVRLPFGAKIARMEPAPSARFEDDGFTYLMYRRYYLKGERVPLQVVYHLD